MTSPSDRVYIYDSTLRDGAQSRGVDFTVADKQAIAKTLDKFGIDYLEGGFAGANPTDDEFFAQAASLGLQHAQLTAFGMTRRSGRSADNDPGLNALLASNVKSICIVGKSWDKQIKSTLGISEKENIRMIAESIAHIVKNKREAFFDAEHFFDGYKSNPEFAVACIKAAIDSGARWIILCDTNGGSMPFEVGDIVSQVAKEIPGTHLGIHCHNDTENAVANSLIAVQAGARQVQGTINGIGERSGNANLISIIPSLILKMGFTTGVSEEKLKQLKSVSTYLDGRLNRAAFQNAPYVGAAAFAHKGGMHVSAMAKDPTSYEHIHPEQVGNERSILISDKAGKSNILERMKQLHIPVPDNQEAITALVAEIKQREKQGYAYENADASFELLARRMFGMVPDYFKVMSFRVIGERRFNAKGKLINVTEATMKITINGESMITVAEGNGPVNALDTAMRRALSTVYKPLNNIQLTDFKVRTLDSNQGTKAVTRVVIESRDDKGHVWNTLGVSTNLIDAAFDALIDCVTYKLVHSKS